MAVQKIRTFLWFDTEAEEAANFYVSLFKNSRITNISRYSEAGPGPAGTAMVVEFELDGIQYLALNGGCCPNGGPIYKFTEAISLSVDCADQAEVDYLWDKLSEGSPGGQCGWIKDRYGLSWQIVPSILPKLMSDPKRSGAVMQALMQMTKLDIQKLQHAFDGK